MLQPERPSQEATWAEPPADSIRRSDRRSSHRAPSIPKLWSRSLLEIFRMKKMQSVRKLLHRSNQSIDLISPK